MPNGTNWTGGRGKRVKQGLRILEPTPEQHFAKQRTNTYNLIIQDQSQEVTALKPIPTVSFQHAQKHILQQRPHNETTRFENSCHSDTSIPLKILSKPSRPPKRSQLLVLVNTAVQNVESLDAKRAQIKAMDPKTLAGLDNFSKKRKYTIDSESPRHEAPAQEHCVDPPTRQSSYLPTLAKSRAFIASPSPESTKVVEHSEEMLSFGTPSDQYSVDGTQISTISRSNSVTSEEHTNWHQTTIRHPTPASDEFMELPISIEVLAIFSNLYENAVRAAAEVLNLPDNLPLFGALQACMGTLTYAGPNQWSHSNRSAQPNQDDSSIRTFNLFAPAQANVPNGTAVEPGPRMELTFREERNPEIYCLDANDTRDEPLIDELERAILTQNTDVHDRHTEIQDPSMFSPGAHENFGMGATKATKSRATRKVRRNRGRGSVSPSAFNIYAHPSHCDNLQRSWDLASLSSEVLVTCGSQVQGDPKDIGSSTIAKPKEHVYRHGSVRTLSAESGASSASYSSQENQVSLAIDPNNSHTIGLRLFSDHSDIELDT